MRRLTYVLENGQEVATYKKAQESGQKYSMVCTPIEEQSSETKAKQKARCEKIAKLKSIK